jgi:hypothetical protein
VVGTGWSWLRFGTGGGHLWVKERNFWFHNNAGNFLISCQDWLASQEGLCSMEWVKNQVSNRSEGPESGRGISLHFLDLGTRKGGCSATSPGCFAPGIDPVLIVQEVGWAPRPGWTCANYLVLTRIRSSDPPARSQSLYRLRFRGLLVFRI